MASEVIEHVTRPGQFLADLAAAAAPGGQVFITTLNRTPAAYGMAIVAAEYLLRFVPPGTHDWHKFITPQVRRSNTCTWFARCATTALHAFATMHEGDGVSACLLFSC
jgi:ubiquinone biosynthesis O-methyltransferase